MEIEGGNKPLGQVARRSTIGGLAFAALALVTTRFAVAQDVAENPAQDALTPVRERYASLETYSDVGSVLVEQQGASGPLTTESGTFKTLYRAPRFFFFDYVEDPASGDDRFVIWCDGGDFQSWWAATGQHMVYSNGRGATAFFNGDYPTLGTSMAVPGLIFARAQLGGSIAGLTDIHLADAEEAGGRRFARISADTLVAGSVVRPHPTTLLIDPDTLLLHKLVEDGPPGTVGLDRRTTTFEPQANGDVDDGGFKFMPPI